MAKIIHEQFLCQLLLQLSLKPNILSLLYWHMLALDQIWKWKLFALCSLSRVHLLNWIPILVQRMFVDLKYYFWNFHLNNFGAKILTESSTNYTQPFMNVTESFANSTELVTNFGTKKSVHVPSICYVSFFCSTYPNAVDKYGPRTDWVVDKMLPVKSVSTREGLLNKLVRLISDWTFICLIL